MPFTEAISSGYKLPSAFQGGVLVGLYKPDSVHPEGLCDHFSQEAETSSRYFLG